VADFSLTGSGSQKDKNVRKSRGEKGKKQKEEKKKATQLVFCGRPL